MPDARIHASAVRIMTADDHVINSYQCGKHAHRGDQPEGGVSRDGKCEADDVGFARAPVPVKNGCGARAVNVTWTPGQTSDHIKKYRVRTSKREMEVFHCP